MIQYFDISHAVEVHDEIIKRSGGLQGVINLGNIESALEHIQNDDYYPNIEDKLTHLFFAINKFHGFQDGNKRSSIALSAYFLEINGLDVLVGKFIKDMENICVDVADNIIEKELLLEIMTSFLFEDDYSEELKLKILLKKEAAFNNMNSDI